MEDFKSAVVLLVASLASLTALLKLNMAIISLTKLAYRRRRNLLVNTMERMKRRRVFRSQTLLATKNRRGRRSMWERPGRSKIWWNNFLNGIVVANEWRENFRMTRDTFMTLTEELRPFLEKTTKVTRESIFLWSNN